MSILFLLPLTALLPAAENSQPVELGTRLELFVDSFLIESLDGTSLQLHHPHDEGAVFKFDAPWEGGSCAYLTVLKDGDLYRLYYRGGPSVGKHDNSDEQTCYAESKDGKIWIRPKLGLHEFGGNKDNNIILKGNAHFSHNFSPFIDKRPGIPVTERYKALAGSHQTGLHAFVSADGLHWKKMSDKPVLTQKSFGFDSQNVAFWSESEGKYVCYFRIFADGVRSISRVESNDFLHWTPELGMPMTYGNTPREHLYTNQTAPYYRAPHIYLATAARFMQGKRLITPEESKSLGITGGQDQDCSDSVLMATRGGNIYSRTFMEGLIRPGFGLENWNSRSNYPARGIVPTGKQEMSMYVQHHYSQPGHELHRYSMRIDGLVSVNAPYQGGKFTTKPLTFTGKRLILNCSTSAPGTVQVEIQDESGKPVPGYELANSPVLTGNWLDKEVVWKNGKTPASLIGKTVKLHFVLKDADLYSLRFAE